MNHIEYAKNRLTAEIVSTATENAKTASPKVYKELLVHAPHFPVYDPARVPDKVMTAWNVAVRVEIDALVKRLLAAPKPTPKAKDIK